MQAADALSVERINLGVGATSKKRVLEISSELLAGGDAGLQQRDVFEALVAREKLGGTGIGWGVAIPHARLSGLRQLHAAFVALSEPVSFDAIDGKPVDLIFAMAVPEDATDEHLQLLSSLARLFNQSEFRDALRGQSGAESILQLFSQQDSYRATG
jgi:PTS system nitrogen regulatory IIA component